MNLFKKNIGLRSVWKNALLIVFCIALFMRLYKLGSIPLDLHNDEVANAYAARYIIENGFDLYGNPWPILYFDKFNDYPPVIPMYVSGIGTYLFGNNEFGARSLIAIIGALVVFPVYKLAFLLFKNKLSAILASLLFALGPWHIVLSRLNAEGIMALSVYLYGLSLLFSSFQTKNLKYFFLSTLVLLSTYLMYPSFRIITPLTFLPLIFLAKIYNFKGKKFYLSILIVTITSFILTFYISSTVWGKGRFEQTSLLSPVSGVGLKLQQLIFNEDNIIIARIYNNKIVGYSKEFLYQYSRYFSFNYLFDEDGIPHIYSIPHSGLLHLSIIPLILASLLGVIQKMNDKSDHKLFLYLIYILLISPIPAALTVIDVPSIHRALLTPALIIFIVIYGFNGLIKIKKYLKYILPPLIILFVLETIFIYHNYFQHFSYYNTVYRTNGNTEAVKFAIDNQKKYDAVIFTKQENWLPIFYLFYANNYDPALAKKFKYNLRIDRVQNVFFPEDECPSISIAENQLNIDLDFKDKKVAVIEPITCRNYYTDKSKDKFEKAITIKRLDETEVFDVLISEVL
jgi:4-amino-4-deoxy-L-arabinose transferase-like glycosyltransferase